MSMSFLDLQNYTRQRLAIEKNQSVSDTELQIYLNMSLASLDLNLVTDYEDYRLTKYLAAIAGTNVIPLPPDFFKLRAVDFGSPGAWVTIYVYGLQERNRYNNPIGNMFAPYGNQAARKVRVMDNSIFVEPENISAGQYQVWYTPKYKNLVLPTDLLPTAMDTQGFIEYAVASTGVKVYNKLNLPSAGFMEEMKYYEELVRNGAKNRMSSGPKCVQNIRNIADWNILYSGGSWGGICQSSDIDGVGDYNALSVSDNKWEKW